MIVLCDTSPLNYLILIGHAEILAALFGEIVVPNAVRDELQRVGTPETVRQWMANPPSWLVVRMPSCIDSTIELGLGEVEAISLAIELHADLLLMDDRLGRRAAESRGLSVAGTLNILDAADERGLLDLPTAIMKLQQTNFRASQQVLTRILADTEQRKRKQE